ncbi:MAG: metallophosphoesterase family protein [Gemmatimonadales bacterium]
MSSSSRFAVISDVHGNLPALEAVMADIERRGVATVVNLGDHVSGPLWPFETAALLMRQPWTQIRGNHERQLLEDPATHLASDRFAFERLSRDQLAWIAARPATAMHGDLVMLSHGTPTDDNTYLLETIEHGRFRLATDAEIQERMGVVAAQLLLCGHSHFPRSVLTGGVLVVNPGSVGLPAFLDPEPTPYVGETGSPHARYAIIESVAGSWTPEHISIAYDHERAAAQAERNGFAVWARALRTGRAG